MKVAVEDISPVKKKIRIEVPPDAVTAEMNKAIADIAKKAKIPGFRPGKAPKAIVEKHYAEEVRSDVVNRLITDSYFRAVHEQKISVHAQTSAMFRPKDENRTGSTGTPSASRMPACFSGGAQSNTKPPPPAPHSLPPHAPAPRAHS